jgi:hypothetical protein
VAWPAAKKERQADRKKDRQTDGGYELHKAMFLMSIFFVFG